MKESTIRDARNQFTSLIREAERGRSVSLTRRGKPVAVLLSKREYERMKAAQRSRPDFLQFLSGWRREMIAKGIPFVSDEELPPRLALQRQTRS